MAATGFLDLPAELRVEIYEWVYADNTVPTSELKSLSKRRWTTRASRNLPQMVHKILNDDAIPFTFTPSKKFSKVRQLTIRLPANYLIEQTWDDYAKFDSFYKLVSLPLESVTVKLTYADINQHEHSDGCANKRFANYALRIAKAWLPGFAEPNARKIVFVDLKVHTLIQHPTLKTLRVGDSWKFVIEKEIMAFGFLPRTGSTTFTRNATQ